MISNGTVSSWFFLEPFILSIADPITDILTLVEFYPTDHKTWLGVGLIFIILPSLTVALNFREKMNNQNRKNTSVRLGNSHILHFLDAIHSIRPG